MTQRRAQFWRCVGTVGFLALAVWGQIRLVRDDPFRWTTLALWMAGLSGIAIVSLWDRLYPNNDLVCAFPDSEDVADKSVRTVRQIGPRVRQFACRLAGRILDCSPHHSVSPGMTTPFDSARASNVAGMRSKRGSGEVDWLRIQLGALAVVSSFAVWRLVGPRASSEPVYDALGLWILSMAAILLAVGGAPTRRSMTRLWREVRANRSEIAIVVAITIVALLIRIFPYGSYPRTMSGDEGVFAVQALEVSAGNTQNLFAVGMAGHINFTFAALAAVMEAFGETVGGSRLLSAGMGAAAIPATYLLARTNFGRLVASMSAIVLATSFMALFWSRNTLNNVSPILFAPIVIWLLDQGLIGRRRVPALLAGFAIGLSLLFYSSSRIFLPLAVIYVGYAVFFAYQNSERSGSAALRSIATSIVLTASGLLISAMPVLSHFLHNPGSFNHRVNQVSVFTTGWLESEAVVRDQNETSILFDQFRIASLVPFGNVQRGTFIHVDPPLLGWPVVLFAAIGLAIVTLTFWKRSHFGLAACFWLTAAGTAITIGAHEPHKLVTSISVLAILTSLGIVSIVRLVMGVFQPTGRVVAAASLVCALVIAGWGVNAYFADPDQYDLFSDSNTVLAHSLAVNAAKLGPGTTVYFLGAPFMTYGGFSNLQFIARNAIGIDLIEPVELGEPPPAINGPTIFAVIAARESELTVIREWFPEGVEARYEWPDLGYLYSTITVFPDTGLHEDAAGALFAT